MKPTVYFKVQKTALGLYTANTIKHFLSVNGIPEVSEEEAEYIFVSICDPDDLPLLVSARKKNPDKIIVMGGFEGYSGEPYLAWADYVVVGEAWRVAFRRATPIQALKLGSQPKYKNSEESLRLFRKDLEKKGLSHLIDEQTKEPCSRIHVSYKKIKDNV